MITIRQVNVLTDTGVHCVKVYGNRCCMCRYLSGTAHIQVVAGEPAQYIPWEVIPLCSLFEINLTHEYVNDGTHSETLRCEECFAAEKMFAQYGKLAE
jgi:hypothetical protein